MNHLEKLLATQKEYDWKVGVQHKSSIEKLEDRFILEYKNAVARKIHVVTDIVAAVDKTSTDD